ASAYVDEHDLCFLGGFPGQLQDLLGIWNEEIDALYDDEKRKVSWNGRQYEASDFCELVHLRGASQIGRYDDDFYAGYPAITVTAQ
ncbi:beta-galactosidase trimerization domain-containing protein, partial [Escherichia coli]